MTEGIAADSPPTKASGLPPVQAKGRGGMGFIKWTSTEI